MKKNDYLEEVLSLLSIFPGIFARKMFGGFGLYKQGIIFGLIIRNELYFKGRGASAAFFQDQGSETFSYEKKGKRISLCYWKVSPDVFECPKTLEEWMTHALENPEASK